MGFLDNPGIVREFRSQNYMRANLLSQNLNEDFFPVTPVSRFMWGSCYQIVKIKVCDHLVLAQRKKPTPTVHITFLDSHLFLFFFLLFAFQNFLTFLLPHRFKKKKIKNKYFVLSVYLFQLKDQSRYQKLSLSLQPGELLVPSWDRDSLLLWA